MAWVWQEYDLREKLEFAVDEGHIRGNETLGKIVTDPRPDEIEDDVWTLLNDLVLEGYGSPLTPAAALELWPPEYDAMTAEAEDGLYVALERQYGTN